eukprot:620174_1
MMWDGIVVSQSNPSFSFPSDIIGRLCVVNVSGRWKGFFNVVEDATALDCATGISVTSRGWKSENGAKKHALEELCKKLHSHFERERAQRRAREEKERLERERIAREAEIQRLAEQLAAQQLRHAQEVRQQLQQRRTLLITQLNAKQNEYNQKHSELLTLQHQITTEEVEIAEFKVERDEEGTKLIIILGHTGDGKSTFCNRLCGDVSLFGDEGPFETSGNGQSCTQTHSKSMVQINAHKIVMVDTPGFGDSFGRDREHANKLCKYLKGCGGINNILLIRNATNVRFDEGFQKMLQEYHAMFGDMFFKLLIIVATRIDSRINKLQFEQHNQAMSLQQDIRSMFDLNITIPVIAIGLENYKESMDELMDIVSDDKFECQYIQSPIDELKARQIEIRNRQNTLQEQVDSIQNDVNVVNESISSL